MNKSTRRLWTHILKAIDAFSPILLPNLDESPLRYLGQSNDIGASLKSYLSSSWCKESLVLPHVPSPIPPLLDGPFEGSYEIIILQDLTLRTSVRRVQANAEAFSFFTREMGQADDYFKASVHLYLFTGEENSCFEANSQGSYLQQMANLRRLEGFGFSNAHYNHLIHILESKSDDPEKVRIVFISSSAYGRVSEDAPYRPDLPSNPACGYENEIANLQQLREAIMKKNTFVTVFGGHDHDYEKVDFNLSSHQMRFGKLN